MRIQKTATYKGTSLLLLTLFVYFSVNVGKTSAVNFNIELNVSCLGCTARFSVETWIILLKGFVARVWIWMSGRNFGDQDTRKKTHQFVRLALHTYSFSPGTFTTSGKGMCSSILTWCTSHRVSEICAIGSRFQHKLFQF